MYGLTDNQLKVLSFLSKNKVKKLMDIGNIVGINHPQKVKSIILQLISKGYIRKHGNGYDVIKNIVSIKDLNLNEMEISDLYALRGYINGLIKYKEKTLKSFK